VKNRNHHEEVVVEVQTANVGKSLHEGKTLLDVTMIDHGRPFENHAVTTVQEETIVQIDDHEETTVLEEDHGHHGETTVLEEIIVQIEIDVEVLNDREEVLVLSEEKDIVPNGGRNRQN
jgi:hypothetical protein